jgi:hypothetical protein
MESSYLDIDLHLEEIKHLFVDPELNPFAYQRLQISGAEEAANHLRTKKRKVDRIRLTVFLPSDQIEPDLQSRTTDALSRYCDFKISENQRRLEIERAAGWRAVTIGLIFSALCLLVAITVHRLGTLDDALFAVFVGLLAILIWMAIWNPAEAFLYGLQPYKLEIRTYKALKNAEIIIKDEPQLTASTDRGFQALVRDR